MCHTSGKSTDLKGSVQVFGGSRECAKASNKVTAVVALPSMNAIAESRLRGPDSGVTHLEFKRTLNRKGNCSGCHRSPAPPRNGKDLWTIQAWHDPYPISLGVVHNK